MSRLLERHLASWFGAWPEDRGGIRVVPSEHRDQPTWDGAVRPLLGAVRADGSGALVVSPRLLDRVAPLVDGRQLAHLEDDDTRAAIGRVVAGEGARAGLGVLRWIAAGEDEVADDVDDIGVWLDHRDPRVPAWLEPFGGEALVVLDEHGEYAAGVGVKRHDDTGHELAVVTEEEHRGRGLARRLVATAARAELSRVPVVTYLHDRSNTGSARVADAVGFTDRGWSIVGVFGGEARG